MTADKTSGSLYLLTCLAQFDEGWRILDDALLSKGNKTNLQEVLEALESLCCFDAWTCLDKYWKVEDKDKYSWMAQVSICHLLQLIKTHSHPMCNNPDSVCSKEEHKARCCQRSKHHYGCCMLNRTCAVSHHTKEEIMVTHVFLPNE